jgi:hypothetical protein
VGVVNVVGVDAAHWEGIQGHLPVVAALWRTICTFTQSVLRFKLPYRSTGAASNELKGAAMMTKPIQNLRHYSRIPFDADVSLHLDDRVLTVHLVDIALKGALVETSSPQSLVLHEKCRLVLTLTQGGDAITMVGHIAHLEGLHIGIECVGIDISSLTLLRRLIELNTGDSDRINRELSNMFAGTWVA